jgi:Asp-tRNA(Asn)/Glu-tRNA(Gln) amidotransferase A subunit family amidase
LLIFALLFAFSFVSCENQTKKEGFSLIEATISDIHAAYRLGELNCRQLVEVYLERIQKYDKRTKLNSIVVINPHALERADELDMEFRRTGILRPLHGIPLIVKDNYETKDLQTTTCRLLLALKL